MRSTLLREGFTAKKTHSRRHSANIHVLRSAKYESNSDTSSMDSHLPHEDILRARLERVLDQQTRRSSGGVFGWLWHTQDSTTKSSSKPNPPRSASAVTSTEPFAPNKLQRQAWSTDNVPMLVQPLTPPPTPPRRKHRPSPRYPSSFNDDEDDEEDNHELTPTSSPTFNARAASQQCRAIEGYVSFAQVEGLGEPPTSACPTNGSMNSLLLQSEEEKKSGWRWFWRT